MIKTDNISSEFNNSFDFELIPHEIYSSIFGELSQTSDILSSRKVCRLWDAIIVGDLENLWDRVKQRTSVGSVTLAEQMRKIEQLPRDLTTTHVSFFKRLASSVNRIYPTMQIGSSFLRVNYAEVQEMARQYDHSLRSCWSRFPVGEELRLSLTTAKQIRDYVTSLSLQDIRELNLSALQLTVIPPEVMLLKGLQVLQLQENQLKELPGLIGHLTSLVWLNVSANCLSSLPKEIGELRSLEILALADNRLTCLPATIGDLSALEDLCLGNNRLQEVPATMGLLSSLHYLNLSNNLLTELPVEIRSLDLVEGESLLIDDNYIDEGEGITRDVYSSDEEDHSIDEEEGITRDVYTSDEEKSVGRDLLASDSEDEDFFS